MSIHGSSGGIFPISRSNPSANRAKTAQPTHMLMMLAFLLCRRIALAIIRSTSSFDMGSLIVKRAGDQGFNLVPMKDPVGMISVSKVYLAKQQGADGL